ASRSGDKPDRSARSAPTPRARGAPRDPLGAFQRATAGRGPARTAPRARVSYAAGGALPSDVAARRQAARSLAALSPAALWQRRPSQRQIVTARKEFSQRLSWP